MAFYSDIANYYPLYVHDGEIMNRPSDKKSLYVGDADNAIGIETINNNLYIFDTNDDESVTMPIERWNEVKSAIDKLIASREVVN